MRWVVKLGAFCLCMAGMVAHVLFLKCPFFPGNADGIAMLCSRNLTNGAKEKEKREKQKEEKRKAKKKRKGRKTEKKKRKKKTKKNPPEKEIKEIKENK